MLTAVTRENMPRAKCARNANKVVNPVQMALHVLLVGRACIISMDPASIVVLPNTSPNRPAVFHAIRSV